MPTLDKNEKMWYNKGYIINWKILKNECGPEIVLNGLTQKNKKRRR